MIKRIFTIVSIICIAIVVIAAAAFLSAPTTYLPMGDNDDENDDMYVEDLD